MAEKIKVTPDCIKLLPNEVPCFAVCILYDEKVMNLIFSEDPDEKKFVESYFKAITAIADSHKHFGVSNSGNSLVVLVDAREKGAEFTAIEIVNDYVSKGYVAKMSKRIAIADGRYKKEPYDGFLVELPPYEIEQEIIKLLEDYCYSWKVTQYPRNEILFYDGDLGGGRSVTIAVQGGHERISAGMNNGTMHHTKHVRDYWKDVLGGLEKDILEWQKDHPSIAKKKALA